MMTKRSVVKVMDFGIARAMQSGVTSMTQTGMVVGTPQYLSPEQALGRGVDARSDLYSVGIMLFQLTTGRLPFEADSPLAIAYAHVQEEPVAPSSINRSLPPAVDALVARALKKNPNERFPSAEAMRDECLRVAASLQPLAPSIVPGAQTSNGAGVSSAVFPPIDQTGAPQSGSVQTPYQPPSTGGYGHPTPAPAPAPSYGYPQQGGYQTPPQTAAYAPQQGAATPPPYNIAPQQSSLSAGHSGGGKSNKGVVIGAIVVSLVAIGGLITALTLSGKDEEGGDNGAKPSSSPTVVEGHKGPDTSKVVETTECTEPVESYNDPEKVELPDFTFKNIDSVKKCLQAAGWEYDTKDVDENTYGEGTVMEQYPSANEDVDPKQMPTIVLKVSTGNPA
jgi:hypothetical protein